MLTSSNQYAKANLPYLLRELARNLGIPELDGYATCRLIRQQPWGKHIVIIALTGYGQEDDRQQTREAGFDGHLAKPVAVADLVNLLTALLDKA